MELKELSDYAKEKYDIEEKHKWQNFPKFSALCHPITNNWIALFIREWNSEIGSWIEHCDLKCNINPLIQGKSYIRDPIRMRGSGWIGISFNEETEQDVVFSLFDKAISKENPTGVLFEINNPSNESEYTDTPLPFGKDYKALITAYNEREYDENTPKKILEMVKLYEYGGFYYTSRVKNFVKQGKFMEDYEDDKPWHGNLYKYFITYNDLNVNQLRGYFTWRTLIRRGEYKVTQEGFVYMYIFELLCGIGTEGDEDALDKMDELEKKLLDSGLYSEMEGWSIRSNLNTWRFGYCIIRNIPGADKYLWKWDLKQDKALEILKKPQDYSDREIIDSLIFFAGNAQGKSVLLKKEDTLHMFVEVWRYLVKNCRIDGKNIFTLLFGRMNSYTWAPLPNAVYLEDREIEKMDYKVNEVRSYHYENKNGDKKWKNKRYSETHFNTKLLKSVFRETDRLLRTELKTGSYLKEREQDKKIQPYIKEAVDAVLKAIEESKKKKINIDFSGLKKIRIDANFTKNSLLIDDTEINSEQSKESNVRKSNIKITDTKKEPDSKEENKDSGDMDNINFKILKMIVKGEKIEEIIKKEKLFPSIVTDTINEMFFDSIGDNILECDGNTISLIEDYREEIVEILEKRNE